MHCGCGTLLPCGEQLCGWRDVPERFLLRRRHSGGGPGVVRHQRLRDQRWIRRCSGFKLALRGVCPFELRGGVLLPRRHCAAAVPSRPILQHDGLHLNCFVPRVRRRCWLILPRCLHKRHWRIMPDRVVVRGCHGGPGYLRLRRGLQLSRGHGYRGQRVDGQLRHGVPPRVFLCCSDAPARVPGGDVQQWRDHVCRRLPAVQCGQVWPRFQHGCNLQRSLFRGQFLSCILDNCRWRPIWWHVPRRVLLPRGVVYRQRLSMRRGVLLSSGLDKCHRLPHWRRVQRGQLLPRRNAGCHWPGCLHPGILLHGRLGMRQRRRGRRHVRRVPQELQRGVLLSSWRRVPQRRQQRGRVHRVPKVVWVRVRLLLPRGFLRLQRRSVSCGQHMRGWNGATRPMRAGRLLVPGWSWCVALRIAVHVHPRVLPKE
jgi:hypothetical protein